MNSPVIVETEGQIEAGAFIFEYFELIYKLRDFGMPTYTKKFNEQIYFLLTCLSPGLI